VIARVLSWWHRYQLRVEAARWEADIASFQGYLRERPDASTAAHDAAVQRVAQIRKDLER
jgi:hypothetical protein